MRVLFKVGPEILRVAQRRSARLVQCSYWWAELLAVVEVTNASPIPPVAQVNIWKIRARYSRLVGTEGVVLYMTNIVSIIADDLR